jgi:hypothetical protein
MVINNPTIGSTFSPTSISDVTKENAKRFVSDAKNSQSSVSSTIVQLSTQGQMMSRSDRAGSVGESNESASKESSESPSIQFQEGESGGRMASQPSSSPAIAAYAKMTMQ